MDMKTVVLLYFGFTVTLPLLMAVSPFVAQESKSQVVPRADQFSVGRGQAERRPGLNSTQNGGPACRTEAFE